MNNHEWHSGPPPHVGWWQASIKKRHLSWRWWNGEFWSVSVQPTDSPKEAATSAKVRSINSDRIEWTDYWPENARVPRINPEQQK